MAKFRKKKRYSKKRSFKRRGLSPKRIGFRM